MVPDLSFGELHRLNSKRNSIKIDKFKDEKMKNDVSGKGVNEPFLKASHRLLSSCWRKTIKRLNNLQEEKEKKENNRN